MNKRETCEPCFVEEWEGVFMQKQAEFTETESVHPEEP